MTDIMDLLAVRLIEPRDEGQVIDLWRRCNLVALHNDPAKDIERKVRFQRELFFVGVLDESVVATVMAGYEGHRGWINYMAVSPGHRRLGIGRKILAHAELCLRELGCPKINLQVRGTNTDVIAFYERLGFAREDRAAMGKRL